MTPPGADELATMDGPTLFGVFRDVCSSRLANLEDWNQRNGCSGPARREADVYEAMAMAFGKAITSRGKATLKDMADAGRATLVAAAARRRADAEASARNDKPASAAPPDAVPEGRRLHAP